jgi:hypothetical protein
VDAVGIDPEHGRDWVLYRAADYWLWGLTSGLTKDPNAANASSWLSPGKPPLAPTPKPKCTPVHQPALGGMRERIGHQPPAVGEPFRDGREPALMA